MKTMGEFDLIARYFKRPERHAQRVALGIGDDCALLAPTPGTQLAISSDMLVEGRHFLSTVSPVRLGHKALAVNLSDLAACGAKPVAFTLALALPSVDEAWLAGFAQGLFALADAQGCELIGGDTTRGPLNICITVLGEVPVVNGKGQALLRSGARPGDDVYVSGAHTAHGTEGVGDARLALEAFRGNIRLPQAHFERLRLRMEAPTPRVALGQALRGIASAAIDVSDGLLGDLGHVLKASGAGATLHGHAASAHLHESFTNATNSIAANAQPERITGLFSPKYLLQMALAGGDDYELAFTAPASLRSAVQAAAAQAGCTATCIGQIDAEPGLRLLDAQGQLLKPDFTSFDHFA